MNSYVIWCQSCHSCSTCVSVKLNVSIRKQFQKNITKKVVLSSQGSMNIGFEKNSFHKHLCEKSPLGNDTVKGIYSSCIKSYMSLCSCRWVLVTKFNAICISNRTTLTIFLIM